MAQIPMDGTGPQVDSPQIAGNIANWAGAIVSLGLLIGAGVWGYKLLVRDVTGVPVVRAIEGPMREQPIDPGGTQAAHQGLSVNGVAAEGTAAAPADRLVLAPAPIELNENDAPSGATQIAAAPVVTEEPTIEAPAPIAAPAALDTSNVDAVIGQLVGDAEPLGEVAPVTEPAPEVTPVVAKEGLGTSLRPKLRPAQRSQPIAAATPEAKPLEVAAESLPAGTRLVQLGAYASPEIARAEWDKLQTKFGDYLGDKQRVVQKATSGGRTFYRLRAMGFADLSDARRLCSSLKAENADCIPVVTR
ncbi:SPOR domain-containing protein [Cognatishimia activa]|uniref:Sporulation related domain protein n=1 Tax=Cognatishimia activa TaxID=1715691 RepID=A0A0P1IU93_9RHOB|nr:SPOR domain-containing protein [Cognatishimia activa]CUJ33195.1 Sporulation related domain protein [Cognatishimia activa]CUK27119.1 Sporulation related domain protein [Cognatishimia activa]